MQRDNRIGPLMLALITGSLAALLVLAAPALAEPPLSPAAFEALAEGKTLHFNLDGQPFGSEQFFAGRRSLWRFADGACQSGGWTAQADLICFRYESEPDAQCWRFGTSGGRLRAGLVEDGRETGFALELDAVDDTALPCLGPDVGT